MTTQNTYAKYTANVFVAKCTEQHAKGDTILLTTKYGKEHECTVFNLVHKDKEGFFYYSIVRADGFNIQEYAKAKAERYQKWAVARENKANQLWEASHEGREFLSLGEPIKIGHHSEKRHRALIERNHNRMGKSIENSKIAEQHESKSEYWEAKANTINLSMPESLEFFEYKLEEAKQKHENLKNNPAERSHGYSLTYAKKAVNEAEKNLQTAVKLWGSEEEIEQINKEKKEAAEAKTGKNKAKTDFIKEIGGFFAFNSEQFKEGYNSILEDGIIDEGEKVTSLGQGLYIPVKNVDKYKAKF